MTATALAGTEHSPHPRPDHGQPSTRNIITKPPRQETSFCALARGRRVRPGPGRHCAEAVPTLYLLGHGLICGARGGNPCRHPWQSGLPGNRWQKQGPRSFFKTVEAGQAVCISPDACLPKGGDTIVRLEDAADLGGGVKIFEVRSQGQEDRHGGEEFEAGEPHRGVPVLVSR